MKKLQKLDLRILFIKKTEKNAINLSKIKNIYEWNASTLQIL